MNAQRRQRGAALLIAMIIVALVATLATAMVWQQWRAVQVEAAERSRAQSAWILSGALDWARIILREDSASTDNLGEPWAVPLAEARLSTFLAADKDNTDDGPEAFLSGSIVDATSRYNLINLVGKKDAEAGAELAILQRLFETIGVSGELAVGIATNLNLAAPPPTPANPTTPGAQPKTGTAILMPQTVAQLAWFGVDERSIALMTPYVTILPAAAKTINLNTASREVIGAVLNDTAAAQQIVLARQRSPFQRPDQVQSAVPAVKTLPASAAIASSFFEVHGRLRLSDRVLEESSLVQRDQTTVTTIWRHRESAREPGG